MTLFDALGIFSRYIHIVSATTLMGAVLFMRLSGEASLFARYRIYVVSASTGLFLSGIYNLLHKIETPWPYHMVFGVKFLLALHVAAVAIVACKPAIGEAKRSRLLVGARISGLVILLLSAYLRWLSR